jgi:UDP-N-acetylmuramoylalanine--D-glutamate ligase
MLAAYIHAHQWPEIIRKIKTLPAIPFRQEIILKNKNLTVANDSAGTSPDAVMAAISRFSAPQGRTLKIPKGPTFSRRNLILITGGTDKNLDFKDLAKKIKKNIKKNNLFLLEGSATRKLVAELGKMGYKAKTHSSLLSILQSVKKIPGKKTIVFSPGAASFEKFKNEFDRGNKFNNLIKKLF